MAILDYSKLTHYLYIISQELSSFIDWAENWRYMGNPYSNYEKLRSQKVIKKQNFLTWNQLVSTIH